MESVGQSLGLPPCFFNSIAWGATCGGLVAAHRFRGGAGTRQAMDWGIGLFAGSGLLSYAICRSQYNQTQVQLRNNLKTLHNQRFSGRAAPGGSSGSGSSGGGVGGGSVGGGV